MPKKKSFVFPYDYIRIFSGILFIFTSLAKFEFFPSGVTRPEMFSPKGFAFISAIDATGYIFPVIGVFTFCCGLAFLLNRYVALSAVILVPITLNFALFHIFIGHPINSVFMFFREVLSFIPLALVLYLIYSERKKFDKILK